MPPDEFEAKRSAFEPPVQKIAADAIAKGFVHLRSYSKPATKTLVVSRALPSALNAAKTSEPEGIQPVFAIPRICGPRMNLAGILFASSLPFIFCSYARIRVSVRVRYTQPRPVGDRNGRERYEASSFPEGKRDRARRLDGSARRRRPAWPSTKVNKSRPRSHLLERARCHIRVCNRKRAAATAQSARPLCSIPFDPSTVAPMWYTGHARTHIRARNKRDRFSYTYTQRRRRETKAR